MTVASPLRVRRHAVTVATIGLLAVAAATARIFVWPDLAPVPPQVDAIIELGGFGIRDDAALALARDHRAPVVVQSTVIEEADTSRCLPPVPGVTILCFHADPNTTRGEAQAIGRMAQQYGWKSIAIVTTPDHAWRARLRVARCFSGEIYVSLSPLPPAYWAFAIPYQWAATVKALLFERDC